MNSLECLPYLSAFKHHCHWSQLIELKQERDQWIQRESASLYAELLNRIHNLKLPAHYSKDFSLPAITLGRPGEIDPSSMDELQAIARQLIPWRKGPFSLFGLEIDAEWRSDYKWERLAPYLGSLKDQMVLDIGCNNGYFMFRMLEQNPRMVLGIDPVLHNYCQFELMKHLAQAPQLHFELFGVEHIHAFSELFDVIFSMGIIYHHRHPLQQLIDIREALRPGGRMILETIGIPGSDSIALFPEDRYAKMRNVWFVPTLSCLIHWVKRARFVDVEVISDSLLTPEEQRLTDWCPPPKQSLEQFLDPQDSSKTIEGYPAPRRFCLLAKKAK